MAYSYIISRIAANEYEDSFDWYEKRSTLASDAFIDSVQNAIEAICQNPYRYRNTYRNLREITLKKYPYNLIYYIDEERKLIIVFSIYHHKRNPKNKYDK